MPKIEELIANIADLSKVVNESLKEVDEKVKESVDEVEYKRYRHFLKRYTKLIQNGELKKAEQLAKDYKDGN